VTATGTVKARILTMDALTIAASVVASASHATAVLKAYVEKVKDSGRSDVFGDGIELQMAMMDLLQRQGDLLEANHEMREGSSSLWRPLKFKPRVSPQRVLVEDRRTTHSGQSILCDAVGRSIGGSYECTCGTRALMAS
jgi:hypothetical protein